MDKKGKKKSMAYKGKGKKMCEQGKQYEVPSPAKAPSYKAHKSIKDTKAPKEKYMAPKSGEQSMSPSHKKKTLPKENAPDRASGVNEGEKMSLPDKV